MDSTPNHSNRRTWTRHLPWIDSGAALTAGVAVLLLHDFLVALYALPASHVLFIGVANASYSLGGLTLGVLRTRVTLVALVAANFAWVAVCAVLLIQNHAETIVFRGWPSRWRGYLRRRPSRL